jgi:hypothetical protein
MAKEPKLLAEIRANKARAEKAAKHVPPVPVGPIMSATVETLATPNAPDNYIAQTLKECATVEHCQELLDHAKQHGYADDGQTVKLIRERLSDLGWKDRKHAATKRGGRR